MKLDNDQFPLRAMGTNVYGRMWSSPLLVAATPEIAEQAAAMLNEAHVIQRKVLEGGPLVVTMPGQFP